MKSSPTGSSSLASNPPRPSRVTASDLAVISILLLVFFVGCRGADWTFRLKDLGVSYGGATISTTVELERSADTNSVSYSRQLVITNSVGPVRPNP